MKYIILLVLLILTKCSIGWYEFHSDLFTSDRAAMENMKSMLYCDSLIIDTLGPKHFRVKCAGN